MIPVKSMHLTANQNTVYNRPFSKPSTIRRLQLFVDEQANLAAHSGYLKNFANGTNMNTN